MPFNISIHWLDNIHTVLCVCFMCDKMLSMLSLLPVLHISVQKVVEADAEVV